MDKASMTKELEETILYHLHLPPSPYTNLLYLPTVQNISALPHQARAGRKAPSLSREGNTNAGTGEPYRRKSKKRGDPQRHDRRWWTRSIRDCQICIFETQDWLLISPLPTRLSLLCTAGLNVAHGDRAICFGQSWSHKVSLNFPRKRMWTVAQKRMLSEPGFLQQNQIVLDLASRS